MFTRTARHTEIPEQERMDLDTAMCPPHEFEAAWASAPNAANHDDTVPALYCKACGDIRAFTLPSQ